MSEPFEAIGFMVNDEASYQALAREARDRGILTRASRTDCVLHGCCWSLGAGLEVWTVLYEDIDGVYYADCRPAFRTRQIYQFYPWEIIEYEHRGEAILSGSLKNSERVLTFALQNLTELNIKKLPRAHITAAVSGLAYKARVARTTRNGPMLEQGTASRYTAENDYRLRGKILASRELKNNHTTSDLIWINVGLDGLTLELLINRADLNGDPEVGHWLTAEIWLQGYMLNDQQMEARFEGVDPHIPTQHHWRRLRRGESGGRGV